MLDGIAIKNQRASCRNETDHVACATKCRTWYLRFNGDSPLQLILCAVKVSEFESICGMWNGLCVFPNVSTFPHLLDTALKWRYPLCGGQSKKLTVGECESGIWTVFLVLIHVDIQTVAQMRSIVWFQFCIEKHLDALWSFELRFLDALYVSSSTSTVPSYH